MKLKTELYKGYAVKFADRILGGRKEVDAKFLSKQSNKLVGAKGATKEQAYSICKKIIDKEIKVKGLK